MDNRKALGNYGEDIALKYLQDHGYKLLGRNIRLFCGEIDILMQQGDDLVIIEVKTKSDLSFGSAAEMITPRKKKKLLQLARTLWQKFPKRTVRIDVIAIDNENTIEHLESAVQED